MDLDKAEHTINAEDAATKEKSTELFPTPSRDKARKEYKTKPDTEDGEMVLCQQCGAENDLTKRSVCWFCLSNNFDPLVGFKIKD